MDKLNASRPVLPAMFIAILVSAAPLFGQTPATSPSPALNTGTGDYTVTSNVELGVRGLDVNGDHEKYRSDLNYQPGFRLFDSSILIQDNRSAWRAFDNALFMASGWGADPSSSFRVNMDKLGIYKLDGNVRRVRYFNNLKNHVATYSQPVQTGSQHRANTLHHFGDFDLTLFPERDLRFRLGYGFNETEGPGTSTLRFRSDEYQVNSAVDTRSDDFRAGVEGKLFGFNLGLLYGHRRFKDRTDFLSGLNTGNNLASSSSFINTAIRRFNVVGTTNFFNLYFQRTFAERLDMTGRVIYAESESKINEGDSLTGRASSTGDFILSDQITVPGLAGRPQTRVDFGVTYRATRKFRISNTFTFDQFSIAGSNTLSELVLLANAAGAPLPSTFSSSSAWRSTAYKRFSNLIEGDYQFNNRFSVNAGYRYTHREVFLSALDRNLVTGATTLSSSEEEENQTNSIILGTRIKPTKNWTIYADAEIGEADNVFTRLANNDYVNFRVRSRAVFSKFSFDVAVITKDNDNPGVSSEIRNSSGALLLPPRETIANTISRIYSGNVEWAPNASYSFNAGYTYTFQNSEVDIIVPVGTPIITTGTQFLFGRSEFYQSDNYFYFDVTAQPIKRLSIYAAYRFNDDDGQGDRLITRPQDIITGYPMKTHAPEIKLAIRLTRNIDWNLGYQYYSYKEPPFVPPFVTPATVYPAQNYTAHMPYTSLRFYFGRAAVDR